MKRLIALALVLLMVFALVGCGKPKRQIVNVTLSTEDSEAILAAAGITLPDVSVLPAQTQLFSGSLGMIPSTTTAKLKLLTPVTSPSRKSTADLSSGSKPATMKETTTLQTLFLQVPLPTLLLQVRTTPQPSL